MKNAIILHGMPSYEEYYDRSVKPDAQSNGHWLPWLQKELLLKDVLAQTPEMPKPYEPEYQAWKEVFEYFPLNEDTILVGHSCGSGFLLRYLSENDVRVGNVALVAPWIDVEKSLTTGMFDFELNPEILNKAKNITIFISKDDDEEILNSVEAIESKIPGINIKWFEDMGHFTYGDMNTREFPELLHNILEQ